MINPAMESRKQRLENIKIMLDKLTPVPYYKALAVIMVNTGAKKETAKDYLRTVMEFHDFKLEDGIIIKPVNPE
jgi:hypothetical protein